MKRGLGIALLAIGVTSIAQAAEIKESTVTCADLRSRYELTPEAQTRFAALEGSCQGVVEIDGSLYALTKAVVRSASSSKVRLYLPATDKTIEVSPRPETRVLVDGRKVRPRDLNRGDEITIHLSVDRLAQERSVAAVSLVSDTAEGAPEVAVEEPVTEVAALPTTASNVPAIALGGLALLGLAFAIRRIRLA
jgi:hypothetical protein